MIVPGGFVRERAGSLTLLVRESLLHAVRRAGLGDPRRWDDVLEGADAGAGRGPTGRLSLPTGLRIVVKKMRRGGWLGSLWKDRFLGTGRPLSNLALPAEVARRGIPTAAPVALLLRGGPPGFFEAWLAFEEVTGASDLFSRLSERPSPAPAELAAVMGLVRRIHDLGLEHHDLNLGNLLVRKRSSSAYECFVVDLDRVILRDGPVPFRARQSALRRIERSYLKRFGLEGPLGSQGSDLWYSLYAATDSALARRLTSGRRAGRVWLLLHRLGWRRFGSLEAPSRRRGKTPGPPPPVRR